MKAINLSNGGFTIVDDDLFAMLSQFTWSNNGIGYIQGWIDGRCVLMHRFIMNAKKGKEIDHINRLKYDNRRENLRFCTHRENMANTVCSERGRNYYRDSRSATKCWRAYIYKKRRQISLGSFTTEEEAAKAVEQYRLKTQTAKV